MDNNQRRRASARLGEPLSARTKKACGCEGAGSGLGGPDRSKGRNRGCCVSQGSRGPARRKCASGHQYDTALARLHYSMGAPGVSYRRPGAMKELLFSRRASLTRSAQNCVDPSTGSKA